MKVTKLFQLKRTLLVQPANLYGRLSLSSVTPVLDELYRLDKVCPVSRCMVFYLYNHVVWDISRKFSPYEDLPEIHQAILQAYLSTSADTLRRVLAYLILATTREARYAVKQNRKSNLKVLSDLPESFYLFFKSLSSQINGAGVLSRFLKSPPGMTLAEWQQCISKLFYECKFQSAFGGMAWGAISDQVLDLLTGKTSPEVFLDTVWSLQHNTGTVFNKNMVFSTPLHDMKVVLDVQRSGQIPQYLALRRRCPQKFGSIPPSVNPHFDLVLAAYPSYQDSVVDWKAVEAACGYKPGMYKDLETKTALLNPSHFIVVDGEWARKVNREALA